MFEGKKFHPYASGEDHSDPKEQTPSGHIGKLKHFSIKSIDYDPENGEYRIAAHAQKQGGKNIEKVVLFGRRAPPYCMQNFVQDLSRRLESSPNLRGIIQPVLDFVETHQDIAEVIINNVISSFLSVLPF